MIGRRRKRWFALLPGAALLSGCAATGNHEAMSPSSPAAVAERAHELPPGKTFELCLAAAQELDKKGFDNEAIPQYEKARDLAPQRAAFVARRLAVLYDRQGDAPRALKEYGRALQIDPRDADLLNDLGYFHYRRDDLAVAESWFRKALAINDQHRQATINLAQVAGRQGRNEECLRLFGQVLPPAQTQYNLAVLRIKAGHEDEARACLQRAVQIDPDLAKARTLLEGIQTPAAAEARTLPSEPTTPTVAQPIIQANLVEEQSAPSGPPRGVIGNIWVK